VDEDALALDDEEVAELALTPLERRPRREPQTYQELSPQLDYLYRNEQNIGQWLQFADAKAGGVVIALSIVALDLFRHSNDFIHAHNSRHAAWGWLSLALFVLAAAATALCVVGIARALFPRVRTSRPSLSFFGVVARFPTPEAYERAVTEKRELELIENVATQVWNLACIADDKYKSLRHAYLGAMLFLIAWGCARVALSLAS
jgi:Family of unknown function (DUF5706)